MKDAIKKLPIEKKHELLSMFFANAKALSENSKKALKYLHDKRMSLMKDNLEQHAYLGAEMLAIKEILSIVYNEN